MPGYDLYRADHPFNVKRGRFVSTIKISVESNRHSIPTRSHQLRNVLYRSPSQSQDDFETFLKNFERNLDRILANNPFLTVVFGDFNIKSNLWCKSDKTSYESSKIEGITSQFGQQQLINEPTHHTRNWSSCMHLMLASQPNLVMDSGVHSSLHITPKLPS